MSQISNLASRVAVTTSLVDGAIDVRKNVRLAFLYYSDMAKIVSDPDYEATYEDYEDMAHSHQAIVNSVRDAFLRVDGLQQYVTSISDEVHSDFADEILKVGV